MDTVTNLKYSWSQSELRSDLTYLQTLPDDQQLSFISDHYDTFKSQCKEILKEPFLKI